MVVFEATSCLGCEPRKRGQLKRSTTDMVHLAMSWLDGLEKAA